MRANRIAQLFALAAVVVTAVPAIASGAARAEGTDASVQRGDDFRLRARLEGSGTLMSGNADYRERDRGAALEIRFKVQIEDAQPNSEYNVFLDGNAVGLIITNGAGRGEIAFRTLSDDPDHDPNVPAVTAGSVVTVGAISGTMN